MEATPILLREETERLRGRDAADSARALAPLQRAPDAVDVDTTALAPAEVVERIVSLARMAGATVG